MSVKISTLVWANGPEKAADLLMMLALADNCDDYGQCFPGVERLAKKCRVGAKAARSTLHRLRNDGWLEIITDGGIQTGHGRNRTNLYRLNMDRLATSRPQEVGDESDLPSTSKRPPVHVPTDLPSTGGKPSVEPSGETSDCSATADAESGGRTPPPPHEPHPGTEKACCLVAAWYRGAKDREGETGETPFPTVAKRMRGQASAMTKDLKTLQDWERGIDAAYAAGCQGLWDLAQGVPVQRVSQFTTAKLSEEKAIFGPGYQGALDRMAARDAKILAERAAEGS